MERFRLFPSGELGMHPTGNWTPYVDAQRALDAEREKVAKLEAALDAAQGESTRWFRAARLQREAGRDLRALVRALPNCPGEIKVYPPAVGGICGTYDVRYDFRLESGSSQSIRLAMFHDECEADTYADLLKYRATMDATTPATKGGDGE